MWKQGGCSEGRVISASPILLEDLYLRYFCAEINRESAFSPTTTIGYKEGYDSGLLNGIGITMIAGGVLYMATKDLNR